MKRALLKWLLRLLATMAALVVLVAASVAVVMNTERGTRWALERATHAVPGELLVGEFRGTLWRGLRFDELVYSSDGQRFTATDLEVKVSWAASALGYLRFTHVNATSLVIELEASDGEPAATLAVPPTPVTLSVRASAIGELRLAGGERETVIRDIRLRTVRYEEIHRRTPFVLADVMRFVGLDDQWIPQMIRDNPRPTPVAANAHGSPRPVDNYRDELSGDQITFVEHSLGDLMADMDYALAA